MTAKGLLALLGAAAGALLGAPAAAPAAPAKPLTAADVARIHRFMDVSPFDRGTWGLLVSDLDTGRELYRQNATTKFQAASTTKNFTTAAALDILGRNRRFRTPVVRTGRVSHSGTLAGDLVLVASGDMTMGGRLKGDGTVAYTGFDHTDANEVPGVAVLTPQDPLRGLDDLARQVGKRGIRRVDGDVVIDDRLWKARRVNKEVISPIQVNDNLIDITMTPTTPGRRVTFRTRPATRAYEIEMRVRTVGRGGPLAFEVGEAVGRKVVVTGTLPAGIKPLVAVARVPEPATFARTLFIEALRRAGVEVDAAAVGSNRAKALPSPGVVSRLARVARFTSPPLSEFVKLISKVSHNPGSNTVPFWIGVRAGTPTLAGGMAQIRAFARRAGVDQRQLTLTDGQGSPGNRFSPEAMDDLLTYVQRRSYGKAFLDALPIKGVDGIPDRPELDPATGHVFAKNGLNGALDANGDIEVQAMALAGYVVAGRRRLAFDLVVNHVPILGPDGRPTKDPELISAAFTRFGSLEGITSLLYTSQVR